MSILVIGEHDNAALRPSTLNVVTAARALSSDIDVLIAGSDCQGAADEAATIAGITRVLKADDAALSDGLAENMAPLVQSLAENYSHILAPATTYGKNLLPRAAAILDVQQISDISGIESEDTFVRPIYAGNAIDCTIGVWFGLSTLTAAAFGNMISNFVGLATGGTVERLAMSLGLPSPGLTEAQRSLKVVHRVGFAGTLVGAMLGCALGMVHLFFIDTDKSAILKLQAITQEQEIAFEVECSNKVRKDATAITVRGPDVDGILASMTAALSASGYSVLELRGTHHRVSDDGGSEDSGIFALGNDGTYEDTFIVRPRGSTAQVPDDDLEELGHTILAACKDPLSSHSLKAQVQDLRADNEALVDRVLWLEQALEERQIKQG